MPNILSLQMGSHNNTMYIIKKYNLVLPSLIEVVYRNGSNEVGIDNCVIIVIVIAIIQDVSVLYNMFVYTKICSHVCQNSCGVKRLYRYIAPLADKGVSPCWCYFDQ